MTAQSSDPVAGVAFRAAAILLAGLLLANQILMAWEVTDGAALSARSAAISSMIAVALLPACVEYARRLRAYGLVAGLVLVTALLLAYSAPTTFARISAPGERAGMASQEYAAAKVNKARADQALDDCKAQRKACGTAERDVDRKTAELASARGRLTDNKSTSGGWEALAYVIGVELGIALLFALAARRRVAPPKEQPPKEEPKPATRTSAATWIASYLDAATDPASIEDAYATYRADWEKRATRTTGQDKFADLFQREAKRRGLVLRQAGKRRLYAVA